MDVDIRYLPDQDPATILAQIRAIADVEIVQDLHAPARVRLALEPVRARARDAVGRSVEGEAMSVGRDGASDAISFLEAGIPAVEFGPAGAGHHGPEEWVSISSLARYRAGAARLRAPAARRGSSARARGRGLRAVEGGLA